ncbi:MAG: hypothetical protein WB626_01975 [Bacteroidota bacterium]
MDKYGDTRMNGGRLLLPALLVFLIPVSSEAQKFTSWTDAPPEVRARKSFKRFEWFYRQRAMPGLAIPEGALERAREAEEARDLLRGPAERLLDLSWTAIGPAGVVSTWPAQWGVVSGRVRALAIHPTDPNTVYIGPAAGGIWKTTDAGWTWQDAGVSLASLTFGAIAIDPSNPQVVYAGGGESIHYFNTTTYNGKGLYKSTNGGSSWTQITNGFGSTTHFSALRVSPTSSGTLFAALGSGYYYSTPANEGLWRSTNAGATWSNTLTADDGFDVLPHPTTANRVYAATGGAVSSAGFYRSTNNGLNWTHVTSGLPSSTTIRRMQIALSTGTPSTIYGLVWTTPGGAGTATLYKSTNDGTNWSSTGSSFSTAQGFYDLMVAVNPSNVNEVYVGMEELFRSTDGGSSFSYVGGAYWSQTMHVDFHIMGFAPSNALYRYVGCDGGIYRSTDGGLSWGQLNSLLPTLQYYRLGSHPTDQNTLMGGAQDNGLFRTTNGGSGNWTLVSTGDGMECFYDYATPSTVYASTQNGALVKSTTGGGYGSFSGIQPSTGEGWAWTAPFFMHPTSPQTIYTAAQQPWRSTDGGATWVGLNGGTLSSYYINTMAQSPVTPGNMICAASEGPLPTWPATPPVFVSSNGGTAWTNVTSNIGGSARYITRVMFHPTQGNTCFVVRSGFGSGKIYRSTNLGTTWTNLSGDLPDVPHNDLFIDPAIPSEMYTANDLGVYRTTNGGTGWTRQGSGMPYVPVQDFDFFSSGGVRLLRAATHGRSAYQAALAATQSVQVLVPNGGEVWRIGSAQTIQWNSSGLSGNVAIDLSRNGGVTYESLFSGTANDGSESWTVTGAATPLALVRVSSVGSPAIRDSSNTVFNIIQTTVSVTAPNGGEIWVVGNPGTVQWTSFNMTGSVRLEISRNGGATWDTMLAVTPDDGVEIWPVAGAPTSQALVRVTSIACPWVADTSDAFFTVVQPSVTVTSPDGGETWGSGSVQTIQWSSVWLGGPVDIELSRDGGATFPEMLVAGTPDDGSEPWTVTGPATASARIRVTGSALPSVRDTSNADFSILTPSITLTAPDGGELWPVDSVRTILWSSTLVPGNVSLWISRNGGSTFDTLASSTSNDGAEDWTVTGPPTRFARVRVASVTDPTLSVESAADFTIAGLASVSWGVSSGWNMLSVPVALPDLRKSQVFPSSGSPAYAFDSTGYFRRDTLRYGEGYWLDFDSAGAVTLVGGERDRDSVAVMRGWNMVGSITAAVDADSVTPRPPGIVLTPYYAFNGASYVPADTLEPMRSYWVKVNQAGWLLLGSGTARAGAPGRIPLPGGGARRP